MKSLSELLQFKNKKWNSSYKGREFRRPKSKKIESGLNFLVLIKSWPKIVGPRLAKHTIPLKNQNKILTILTDHPVISQQLSFMEEQLKKIIFDEFPNTQNSIKGFSFMVNPSFFKQKKEQSKTLIVEEAPPELHPYSPKYKAIQKEADELFKDIDDNEIKEAFFSIFIQNKK